MKKGGKQKVIQEKINFLSGGNYFCKQGRKWIWLNFFWAEKHPNWFFLLIKASYRSMPDICFSP